ncbi:hypothetical protein LMTR13_25475 [Bradyrhizobium icense]|uniref:Acyl-CoA dehydrogenase/oxidase C-terminal domain-containing protein n=1 Tax=Bradyrhizobium icense TaxID=1274631 RepID=A0A1B1UJS5_9BRAD|nr:hypothetical protein LMTR13_25475 [Bradyrhizobium icense]
MSAGNVHARDLGRGHVLGRAQQKILLGGAARLVRAHAHEGISFILFDMVSEGVSTRPILLISGESPFCETFFDNVRVSKSHLVGQINRGWDIAKYVLQHERAMNSAVGERGISRPLGKVAADSLGTDDQGRLDDAILRG